MLHVCRCLEHGQQQARAEEACRKALASCPARPSAVLQLAKLLHASSKHQEALNALEHGLQQLSSTSSQSQDPQLALVSHACVMSLLDSYTSHTFSLGYILDALTLAWLCRGAGRYCT